MRFKLNPEYDQYSSQIENFILNFETLGTPFGNQDRNSLKLFQLADSTINIKSFKIPNPVNKIVYRFFRKSKAERSFEYANKLLALGVGTPYPIGYYEFSNLFAFKESYYLSQQVDCDYTFRDLTFNYDIPNHENILRAFTRFTFQLHEKGILFLDHSPGNTLITVSDKGCHFYLVDLNRMEFCSLDLNSRIKNFERLCKDKYLVEIISDEYAKLCGEPFDEVFRLMWGYTQEFQRKFQRKKELKKKLLFWRS